MAKCERLLCLHIGSHIKKAVQSEGNFLIIAKRELLLGWRREEWNTAKGRAAKQEERGRGAGSTQAGLPAECTHRVE
jgi:hypothetical protein